MPYVFFLNVCVANSVSSKRSNKDVLESPTESTLVDVADLYKRLGRRIGELRNAARVSQFELACKIGLSRTSVTNIERGRQRVQIHTLYSIAKAIGKGPADLLPFLDEDTTADSPIGSQFGKLKPNEKSQLDSLELKERRWLTEITAPAPTKTGRRRDE